MYASKIYFLVFIMLLWKHRTHNIEEVCEITHWAYTWVFRSGWLNADFVLQTKLQNHFLYYLRAITLCQLSE